MKMKSNDNTTLDMISQVSEVSVSDYNISFNSKKQIDNSEDDLFNCSMAYTNNTENSDQIRKMFHMCITGQLGYFWNDENGNDFLYNRTDVFYGMMNETFLNDTENSIDYPVINITVGDIFIGIFLGILIVAILFGNSLVLISAAAFQKMRTPSSLLIVSLATADFLVAIMVLPLSLYHEITKVWLLGPVLCDYWITCDVFLCTASMMNVCIIALDRYFKITRNVQYTHNKICSRPRACAIMVMCVWIISLLIAVSPLFGWNRGTEKMKPFECIISQDLGYTIFSTFGAFYIPVTALIAVYIRIYQYAILRLQKRQRELKRKRSSMLAMLAHESGENGNSPNPATVKKSKVLDSLKRSKRSTKMLGVIIGCFVFCWLPFFLLAAILPFCEDCHKHVPSVVSSVTLWLGYFNSFCNPCIYAVWNKQFREAFVSILKCDMRNSLNANGSYRSMKITDKMKNGVRNGNSRRATPSNVTTIHTFAPTEIQNENQLSKQSDTSLQQAPLETSKL